MGYLIPTTLLALLANSALAFDRKHWDSLWEALDLEIVLRSEESRVKEVAYYHNGYCVIDFDEDGSFSSGVWGSQGIWFTDFRPHDPERGSLCDHVDDDDGDIRYKLQSDGTFVFQCNEWDGTPATLDYSTHSGQGGSGDDYFLVIDRDCQLHIYEDSLEEEIWSSDLYGDFEVNDRLWKGQIYHGLGSGYEMILNPSTGSLEVREIGSHGVYDIVWDASDEWDCPPGDEESDFYVLLNPNRALVFVSVNYKDDWDEDTYYVKHLEGDTDSDGCFTLGFEKIEKDLIELVAVPC